MAIKTRSELNIAFAKGKRPKEQDFKDWQESYYHKDEDAIQVTGWTLRSFFKDLRAEGLAITAGGTVYVDIPVAATRLNKFRIIGKGTGVPPGATFTINVNLGFFSDTSVLNLNPITITTNNPLPNGNFFHPLLGAPATLFNTTSTQIFDKTFDFVANGINVMLNFSQVRFLRLTVSIVSGQFPNTLADPSYVYYGLEFE